jgi:hypothetical protein
MCILRSAFSWLLLRFKYVALVDPASSEEAVAHHVLAKKEKNHYQKDYKEELDYAQPG